MVEETFEPGMTVSLGARRHGVALNQLFTWCRLVAQGALTAAGSGEELSGSGAPGVSGMDPDSQIRAPLSGGKGGIGHCVKSFLSSPR